MYDLIVVGGGPAGMTAALYALRHGKSVLVLEKNGFGGQITHSPKVENWPGTEKQLRAMVPMAGLDKIDWDSEERRENAEKWRKRFEENEIIEL